MARLVHLTPDANAARMARGGVAPRSRGHGGERGVYCMPVLASFTLTHQWVRELRRWHPGRIVAVHVRVPDDEQVLVGRYAQEPSRVSAARAVAVVREAADPRGFEIFVPRRIAAAEVVRVRHVPQGVGWRYQPGAHGRRPCSCPMCLARGTPGSARVRRRFPLDPPPPTKPELMAQLRAATTTDDIVEALWSLTGRSRGGAEELAYLAGHPDPEVREALVETLECYRGPVARALRERVSRGLGPSAAD